MATDASEQHLGFSIGRRGADHLSVEIVARTHPTAVDYWDGNWVRCVIDVRAAPFGGRFTGDLRTDELHGLHNDMERLQHQLDGVAGFENLDGHLAFEVRGDGRGHFTLAGEASGDPGSDTQLVFRLAFDQTDLPAILRDLDEVVRAFPVRGRPHH